MIFVTRQDPQVLENLRTKGVYTVREDFIRQKYTTITDHYASLYRMLTSMARSRISIPEGLLYPVWLSPEGTDAIPESSDDVFLRLDIPEGSYILANDEVWEHMINHIYYPADEGSAGNFYPLLKQKVLKSWESIYTVKPQDPSHIVGLCWELREEWLIG